ncbi:MAG TPA: 2-oxoglutarate dehydrogenase, E2 component, dihydrolipoamide succinyltransferase [Terracidiphilus sp.]|jgi:2-oxoglutarate dehydrogenase E2 component (dihydrolipoamide succinyltransferase)|nr:2-oxoglutarate dehydrogenase, E2 component, dihydrolipoamide succinyltransferase [Terracidiphilus sp.]
MPTDVVMPQLGESIFEGTITKWLKQPGDAVQKDEPLFEISTDKVDAEIPSPASGTLSEIKAAEGETVQINTVVAVIAEAGAPAQPPAASPKKQPAAASATAPKSAPQPAPQATRQAQPSPSAASGATEVVMPQLGESIFEGAIIQWFKKAGDAVQKDEPLFEISTDKVDAEIPAPVSGILREIRIPAGETVEINTVVAVIGGAGALSQGDGSAAPASAAESSPATEARAAAPPSPAAVAPPAPNATPEPESLESDQTPARTSPLVRRMAREHNLDVGRIRGTGSAGRITKEDVLRHLNQGPTTPTAERVPVRPATVTPAVVGSAAAASAPLQGRLEPMSRMRGIIAQRMLESRQTIPHAYMVYRVDMTRVVRARERARAVFEQRHGVKLTYMPFIAAAAMQAIRKHPIVNARLEGSNIRYHDHVHLGIAVALEWGLIVPVIREAETHTFADLARAMADVAERARTKRLKPDEASGSTFTLTNFGIFGGEFGTPIINPPEAAILAIGVLKKEPVVLTDADGNDTLAIRPMQQHCLGFDHRIVDGADAGKYMSAFKEALENWSTDIA